MELEKKIEKLIEYQQKTIKEGKLKLQTEKYDEILVTKLAMKEVFVFELKELLGPDREVMALKEHIKKLKEILDDSNKLMKACNIDPNSINIEEYIQSNGSRGSGKQ